MSDTFDHIILNGRPGGGKSELIDFIKKTPLDKRRELFHIGEMVEEDDFVWLWEKFVEDDLWEELGEKRIYSRTHEFGYVQLEDNRLLDLVAKKFNVAIKEKYMKKEGFYDDHTVFIEFARGKVDGGYKKVYEILDDEILKRSAILYINVSYEESRRKNEARYQEALKGSILAHKLPDESLERFSAETDFEELTGGAESGYIEIRGIKIPFVSMNNEPELKSGPELDARYSKALTTLKSLAK
ncbi:MAG: hypothetical protein J6S69_02855 [Proteobacteria bacterium]|nr:hypothetical protein [Pseudomonadota bacterium]